MGRIKDVFNGLPESLKSRVLIVDRKYQTNPLSHEPGGSSVVVEYHNGNVFGYRFIKFPSAYILKVWMNDFLESYANFRKYSKKEQSEAVKEEIKRIFARKHKAEDFGSEPYKEVWNFETSNKLPWEALKAFDEIGLDEYLRRQHESPEFQNYLIEQLLGENALSEYLERQHNSREFDNHLIEKAIKDKAISDYLERQHQKYSK